MPPILHLTLPDCTRLAYRFTPGTGSALVFLPGYMSDMSGSKAQAIMAWAKENGRACLLLDYSGCGESTGTFAEGTLGKWSAEVIALIEHLALDRVVLIGSSMGGWIMLLSALMLRPEQRAGLIGIAAAPDFTEWGYTAAQKERLLGGETIYEDSAYGPDPTPIHAPFWRSGQANLLLRKAIAIDCPVRLLHGQADEDVPWELSVQLAETLNSSDVQVHLIKDGDHRLSRDSDITLLLHYVAELS